MLNERSVSRFVMLNERSFSRFVMLNERSVYRFVMLNERSVSRFVMLNVYEYVLMSNNVFKNPENYTVSRVVILLCIVNTKSSLELPGKVPKGSRDR